MEKKKTLVLIDANSIIHRAWHALPPLRTSKGEIVNAVYGFLSVLLKTIKEFEPDYIAATFDTAAPTARHAAFAEYKATRARAPDEFYAQIPRVKEALSELRISAYEKDGFEADDLVGTIAKKAARTPGLETIIVSGDLDMLQLVNGKTSVYTMRKGMQETVWYDEEAVKKRFDTLEPGQLTDYKGLRGDPSDNIPGVSGIGEKTAIQLLKEFRSLEGLYQALQENRNTSVKAALKEKLIAQKRQAFASRDLATINTAVPIALAIADLAWKPPGAEVLRELLSRFEFQSLMNRAPGEQGSAVEQEKTETKIERLFADGVLSQQVYELEKRLTPIVRSMEERGIRIDVPYLESLTKEMVQEAAALQKRIYKHARQPFNVNSPQQLSRALFDPPPGGLGISPKGLKKTPKGVISTASPELEKLAGSHALARAVLHYREIQKLITTYAKPLPLLADKHGRVHTHFDQLGAATGRISSAAPNLQNIPNQGVWGGRIRRGFIAEQGFELVSFDYSQMELRIAAHMSGDERMRRFFEQGADIHRMTAAAVFGVSQEHVSGAMRFRAKALNFGVLYGMGAAGFAKAAGISQEEARDFIEQYFVRFPNIFQYMEKTKAKARAQGYAETLLGRKRYLPELNSTTPSLRAQAERMAINHPIQGSVADIVKMAMVRIDEEFPSRGGDVRMLLQIHDELLFEIAHAMIQDTARRIRKLMETEWPLAVPVQVDVKKGTNWRDVENIRW